jgi:membrane protein implicated in regulation of membrane protease activity
MNAELTAEAVWLVAGLALLIAEVAVPGAFLLWIGLAALGTGCLTFLFDFGFPGEVGLFALLASALVALALRLRRRRSANALNTRESGLLGRTALVISFRGREGRVRVGDSDWPARLPPDVPAPDAGELLTVVGVDGMTVLVHPAHEQQP